MQRIAMLSFAHVHARGYARHIVDHPDLEMTCVWDDDSERGQTAATQFDVPFESDLEATLNRDDVDAVVVNATTNIHRDVILTAVNHGKHVFTEKALAVNLAEAREITAAVQASDIKFMISLPSRIRPETLFAREVIDKGWLGDITLMRARVAHSAALDKWFKGGSLWFGDEELAGGGSLFDLGCHTVDIMRWLLGPPASMVAKIQNYSGAYDIDDQAIAVAEFKSGAMGILDVSWLHRAGPNHIEIYGTEGYLGWDHRPGTVQIQSRKLAADGITGTITPDRLPNALPMPMDQWVTAIETDSSMTITVEDGLNLNEMLEGIYGSARSGRNWEF